MRPNTVVRTASWTRGEAVAVNRDIRSDGVRRETTFRYGLGLFRDNDDDGVEEVALMAS